MSEEFNRNKIYIGDCIGCYRKSVSVFGDNNKCYICTELEDIKKRLEKLEHNVRCYADVNKIIRKG